MCERHIPIKIDVLSAIDVIHVYNSVTKVAKNESPCFGGDGLSMTLEGVELVDDMTVDGRSLLCDVSRAFVHQCGRSQEHREQLLLVDLDRKSVV